ncbi:MAG: bifunctional phosphopantothenoylcysteine decarboxylase/phosphopantothenate--cysteine ligase CoaBC [Proteobacteria bacterium]|nr:bifunctional phosphopantothenoylcysteine decarboxylase/phosphopantothenate--cysteine ligase CoaBC [Pseudomonadota bacterium]
MQDFESKKILLAVCGGIAAFKSAYLLRELKRLGAEVRVVLTESAEQFVTALTFQALGAIEVRSKLFDLDAEGAMSHIELARWADYVVIAPATANSIAKMANGLADDLLSTLYLVTEAPVLVCPAMNRSMWAHPATKANCERLREQGVFFVGPEEGIQACGEEGFGRMAEVDAIINSLRLIPLRKILQGKKIMITAGPTVERIDPVRYISNDSSGKMGYALAEAALFAGAEVTLISGPSALAIPNNMVVHHVQSAKDMQQTVLKELKKDMIFIGAAAVADFAIENEANEKIKKKDKPSLQLKLKTNPDIISEVVASQKASFVVGFAAETNNLLSEAKEKLKRKKLDMLIANQVGQGKAFNTDINEVIILTKDEQKELPLTHKMRLAGQIIAILASTIQNKPNS